MDKLFHEIEGLIKDVRPDWPIDLSDFTGRTMGDLMWYIYRQNGGEDWSAFLLGAMREDLVSDYFGYEAEVVIGRIGSSGISISCDGLPAIAIDYVQGSGDRHPVIA